MRLRIFLMLLGAVLVVATFTFPLWQPYVLSQAVPQAEAFPGLASNLQNDFLSLPPEQQRAYRTYAEQDRAKAVQMVTAALSPRSPLPDADQAMPEMNSPVTVGSGTFQQIDAVRRAQGTVNIYQQADNTLLMRFEDFNMPNGPDLNVYLSAAQDPKTFADMTVADLEPLEIDPLKSNLGSQNYDLPTGTDFQQYHSVVIYSTSLDLVYSDAPLYLRQ